MNSRSSRSSMRLLTYRLNYPFIIWAGMNSDILRKRLQKSSTVSLTFGMYLALFFSSFMNLSKLSKSTQSQWWTRDLEHSFIFSEHFLKFLSPINLTTSPIYLRDDRHILFWLPSSSLISVRVAIVCSLSLTSLFKLTIWCSKELIFC